MNPPKVTPTDYIDFLIGTQQAYCCTEAERVNPESEDGPAHDAYTRLLQRLFPTSERLWNESVSIDYLLTPDINHHFQVGYSLNEILFVSDLGFFVAFEDWNYYGFAVKVNFRF